MWMVFQKTCSFLAKTLINHITVSEDRYQLTGCSTDSYLAGELTTASFTSELKRLQCAPKIVMSELRLTHSRRPFTHGQQSPVMFSSPLSLGSDQELETHLCSHFACAVYYRNGREENKTILI